MLNNKQTLHRSLPIKISQPFPHIILAVKHLNNDNQQKIRIIKLSNAIAKRDLS